MLAIISILLFSLPMGPLAQCLWDFTWAVNDACSLVQMGDLSFIPLPGEDRGRVTTIANHVALKCKYTVSFSKVFCLARFCPPEKKANHFSPFFKVKS
jgi:hypothetical protein